VQKQLKRSKNRFTRRNEAFVRQGEWFFVPAPRLVVNERMVLRNEPLRRGFGSKPHMCQFAYRTGGRFVWVCQRHPRGVTDERYRHLLRTNPSAGGWGWRQMFRDPAFYARGRVWHKDHKTVVLDVWHRVAMNTEREAPFAPRVAFLD
jgi:hypothetical protein